MHIRSLYLILLSSSLQSVFHTSYLEVVNPPSDKLIELFHLVAVANAPTTASEFSHSVLKLRY